MEGGGEIMMASSGPWGKLIELNRRRAKKVVSQVCLDGKDLNARAVSQKQCNFFPILQREGK